jgi:hypothetical protein
MTLRELIRVPAMRGALAACVLATALSAWTLVRAVRLDDIPDAPAGQLLVGDALRGGARPPPPADFSATVEHDPFSPDRTAPTSPYRMPGEPDPDLTPAPDPIKPVVIGTAVSIDGRSFATVRLGDARPAIVHVGDRIGEYTVKSIDRGRVAFTMSSGKRLNVDATVSFPPGL